MSYGITYAGAYELAYSQPRPVQYGPSYAGNYTGEDFHDRPVQRSHHPVSRSYDIAPYDRGGSPALVIADNPQPPGAAIRVNGFVIDALV